jgi:hypothetical protein
MNLENQAKICIKRWSNSQLTWLSQNMIFFHPDTPNRYFVEGKHFSWRMGNPALSLLVLRLIQDLLAFLPPHLLRWLLACISWYQSARFAPADGDDVPMWYNQGKDMKT